jgi:hypothetical protein
MQKINNLFYKIQNDVIFPRIFWIGCQALFGLLPVFILENKFHYIFYSSGLLMSYIGMSVAGINGIANIRWAKSKLDPERAKPYFYLAFLSWLMVAILSPFFIKIDVFTALLIFAGLLQNIKVLGISYLRNAVNKNVSSFLWKDASVFIVGSFSLFFINSDNSLIILISATFSGGLLFFIPVLYKIVISSRKIFKKKNHMYIILQNSIFLFLSSFFITYIPIVARTVVDITQSEAFFVSFSVALSIAVNMQKLSLQYFWRLQKKYWSQKSKGIKLDKSSWTVMILVVSTCLFVLLVQIIFDMINSDIVFPIEVMVLAILIIFHRMSISYYRLHLLTVISQIEILKNQIILTIAIFGLFIIFNFLLSQNFLIEYVVAFIFADIFFVNHLVLKRRTSVHSSVR